MRHALISPLLLILTACDESATPEDVSAVSAEVAALQAQLDAALAALATEGAAQDDAINSVTEELSALTGAVDLTALADTVADNTDRIEDLEGAGFLVADDIAQLAQSSDIATLTAALDSLSASVDDNTGDITSLSASAASFSSGLAAVESDVSDLSDDVSDLSGVADLLTYVSVDTSTDSVIFEGANVFVQSGSGSTSSTVNGLGNLIVGYNETSGEDQSGSHNLVVGKYQEFSSYAGVVFGYGGEVSAPFATVTGGIYNTASGSYSSVHGGVYSTASGSYSSVSGGYGNTASGSSSAVSGGYNNTASGNYSAISGGHENYGLGDWSSILGGAYNTAGKSDGTGDVAVAVGGRNNNATNNSSVVVGGSSNTTDSSYEVLY